MSDLSNESIAKITDSVCTELCSRLGKAFFEMGLIAGAIFVGSLVVGFYLPQERGYPYNVDFKKAVDFEEDTKKPMDEFIDDLIEEELADRMDAELAD